MKTIRIAVPGIPDASYAVRFCSGPDDIAARVAAIARGARVFIVTDRNVARLHLGPLERALAREAVDFHTVVIPAGERSKSRKIRDLVEDRLIRAGAERSSVVAAFGGGVVGDLAGFVASTLYRGVRFVQVPTTLIAQVDSSIGAKVGIDHPLGKNLLGAFHAPEAVLIDTRYLNTLPEREYIQGMAEIIKTAVMLDRRFTRKLSTLNAALRSRKHAALGAVIARCCALKGRVVAADPRESGYRRILNFGHTVGHALERASRYRLPHGFAVSIGMAVESGISLRLGLIGPTQIAEILDLLGSYGLPVSIPGGISRAEIIRAIAFDKKKSAGIVRFTLPGGVGRGSCGVEVPMNVLLDSLER